MHPHESKVHPATPVAPKSREAHCQDLGADLNPESRLRDYCARNSIKVVAHYQDDASAKTFDRPAWKQLITLVRSKRSLVDHVLFVKWDRFSRNMADAIGMIQTLDRLGIEPQAIEQPIDRSIPEQLMMLAIYLAAPEVENERRSLNVIYCMRRAGREGRTTGTAPCGYQNVRDSSPVTLFLESIWRGRMNVADQATRQFDERAKINYYE